MARFLADQSKLVMLHESGTYANVSGLGVWPGQVQSHDIIETQNVIQTRFLGNLSRDVAQFNDGPLDVEGTMTFFPQDWRMLGFAMGSISTTSGTAQTDNYRHSLSATNTDTRNAFTSGTLNPFMSFQIEESRTGPTANQNSMRTFKGCMVNTYTLTVTQGEALSVDVDFIAQTGSWFSGATTAVTAGSHRPYLWSDVTWSIAGTDQVTAKDLTFTLNNNFEGPHYLDGNRTISVPLPQNREYTIEVTQDLLSTEAGSLYDTYFKGGSLFNAELNINNTAEIGSHRLILTLSGCRMINMEEPATIEGVTEVNYTVMAISGEALAHDRSELYTAF